MEPLDLRLAPPRSPKDTLGVTVFFARTIDKFRAALPGGHAGVYKIDGASARILDRLGIAQEDFAARVVTARNDDDIVQWAMAASLPEARTDADAHYRALTIRDCLGVADFYDRYPIAKAMPVETPLLDLLCADDLAMFQTKEPA